MKFASRMLARAATAAKTVTTPGAATLVLLCLSSAVAPLRATDAPAANAPAANKDGSAITGRWLTEPKDGIIEMTRLPDGHFEGTIIGGNEPGKLDTKNPDESLRSKPLRGQVIAHALGYDGDNKYSGGTIYDPNSGSTYKLKMELLADGTLKVRGFIGFSLLGKTQIWTRYTGTSLDLPPAKIK